MGKASSAKKVQRAARAGATARTTERRQLGFPMAIAAVVLIGSGLVVYARSTRDAAAEPALGDHWHAAYGVYDCATDEFQTAVTDETDPLGIHTHADGLIHIHPFSSLVTGSGAQLGVFLDSFGGEVTDDQIFLPGPGATALTAGTECDGEEAIVQVAVFDADNIDLAPKIITSNFDDITFSKDREAITIALAPPGAELPPPPTDRLNKLDEVTGTPITSETPTLPAVDGSTTTVPGDDAVTTTTPDADETTTTVSDGS